MKNKMLFFREIAAPAKQNLATEKAYLHETQTSGLLFKSLFFFILVRDEAGEEILPRGDGRGRGGHGREAHGQPETSPTRRERRKLKIENNHNQMLQK